MKPILYFSIFGKQLSVSTYNLCIGIGLIIAIHLYDRDTKYANKQYTDMLLFASIFAAMCGIFVSYCIYTYLLLGALFKSNNWAISFLPSLIVSYVVISIFLKYKKLPILFSLNLILPYIVLIHAFGRLGCFLAGCCFGKPTDSLLGVTFPVFSPAYFKYGLTPVHPTQLYEMVLLFFLFCALKNIKLNSRINRLEVYCIIYGTGRFIIELFRGDSKIYLLNNWLSFNQVICISMITVGLGIFFKRFFLTKGYL